MKPLKTFAWIALASGLSFASLCGKMALDNNNQGEFHDPATGALHWGAFIPVVILNFACAASLVFGALGLGLIGFRLLKTTVTAGRR